jgi:hypothetical protein
MREKALYRKGKLVGKFEIFTMDPAGEGAGHGSPVDEERDLREDREQAADNMLKNLGDMEKVTFPQQGGIMVKNILIPTDG